MQRSVAAVIGDNISAVCAETAAIVVNNSCLGRYQVQDNSYK